MTSENAPQDFTLPLAKVVCYSPDGLPTTAVNCFNVGAILYAVEHANSADSLRVSAYGAPSTFPTRLYADDSALIYSDAQDISDANGAPVAILSRDGWLAICEEPPDDMDEQPLEHGWSIVALVEPSEAVR